MNTDELGFIIVDEDDYQNTMGVINHEYYVSLEVAKLLEKAGFDWVCRDYYYPSSITSQYREYAKPTLDVAQRWLREVKNIDINILAEYISGHKQYLASIWFSISSNSSYDNIILDNRYTTYEKAQEASIQKCLTILLEEKK